MENRQKRIHPQMRAMIGEKASNVLDHHQCGQDNLSFGFGMRDGKDVITITTEEMTPLCLEELQKCFPFHILVWRKEE